MAIAFGVRLFTNYLTTSLPKMPEEKKTASLKTLNDSLTEFEKAKLEGIKDQDKIARMMQQLIEQIGENPGRSFRRSILMKRKTLSTKGIV